VCLDPGDGREDEQAAGDLDGAERLVVDRPRDDGGQHRLERGDHADPGGRHVLQRAADIPSSSRNRTSEPFTAAIAAALAASA
jgi:hypothetical protein